MCKSILFCQVDQLVTRESAVNLFSSDRNTHMDNLPRQTQTILLDYHEMSGLRSSVVISITNCYIRVYFSMTKNLTDSFVSYKV